MPVAVTQTRIALHRQELEAYVAGYDLERAHRRLLDFVDDYAHQREHRREALLLGTQLAALKHDERRFGPAESTRRDKLVLADRFLQLLESVSDDFEEYRPGAEQVGLDATEAALAKGKRRSSFDEEKQRFVAKRRVRTHDKSLAYFCHAVGHRYRRSFDFELHGVSLELRPGEITGVVGVNGSGKTTLLRIVAGELLPHAGTYGYPLLQPAATSPEQLDWCVVRSQLAYVAQRPYRWFDTLANNLHQAAAYRDLLGQDNIDEVDFILQRLGLEKYRDARWGQLSGGFKMRFELAKALVCRPKLLVLDEPLAPLDIVTQQIFLEDLRDISRSLRRPLPIIISSQHLYEIESTADRVLFIEDGSPRFYGKVEDIGADRTENAFEIGCRMDLADIKELLECVCAACRQTSKARFLIRTPLDVKAHDLLKTLLAEKVELTYFRDLSRSTRTLFPEPE